jgi:ABC-2 type transport system permease protein
VGGFVLILLLSGLFGVAWAGTSFVPALLTRSEQATSALSFLFFPVAFVSTAFVPLSLMPAWMQTLNAWNPITYLIEAIRTLLVSGYDWPVLGQALLAMAALGLILQALTFWSFARLAR